MRQTDVKSVMFPVETRPVQYVGLDGNPRAIESHKAVVNTESGCTLGVVSTGYRLVTNQQALEYARNCALQVFGGKERDSFEVFNVYAPPRPWFCQIDLIHRGFEVNFVKPEVYLPFVRVTNSYNATRALRFDVGYCRELCENGVIFEKETIEFRFSHSHASIGYELDFRIRKGMMAALQRRFESNAARLASYRVPDDMSAPLFFKALELPTPPKNGKAYPKRERYFDELRDRARVLIGDYFRELGGNAYALFSAVTDFASHPPEITSFKRTPHSMQKAAGSWSQTFASKVARNGGFDLEEYLGEYLEVNAWSPRSAGEQVQMRL